MIAVPGASEQTSQVKVLNANWTAGPDGTDGKVRGHDRGRRRPAARGQPQPAAVTALLALAQADTILLWDPVNRTLIAANIIGTWLALTGLTRAEVKPLEPT